MKKYAILALFIAVLSPISVSATTWTTPSGAVVDDSGRLISDPVSTFTVKLPAPVIPKYCPFKKGTLRYALNCK